MTSQPSILATAKSQFIRELKLLYPYILVMFLAYLSIQFLLVWYSIPRTFVPGTNSNSISPLIDIEAVLPLIVAIVGGGVMMYFFVRLRLFKYIVYYVKVVMFLPFISMAVLTYNNPQMFYPFVLLPASLLLLGLKFKKPRPVPGSPPRLTLQDTSFAYSVVCLCTIIGSGIVAIVPLNYGVISLMLVLIVYDFFAVFVFPLKQIAKQADKIDLSMFVVNIGYGHLGLGDLLFYSLLICLSFRMMLQSHLKFETVGFATVGITLALLVGLYLTMYILSHRKLLRPLPALPIPLLCGLATLALVLHFA